MTETTTPELHDWTTSKGEHRRYIDNLAELIGLDIERYRTGNIRSAALDGAGISNRRAAAILAARVWIDDENGVHVDGLPSAAERAITADEIAARVAAALPTAPTVALPVTEGTPECTWAQSEWGERLICSPESLPRHAVVWVVDEDGHRSKRMVTECLARAGVPAGPQQPGPLRLYGYERPLIPGSRII